MKLLGWHSVICLSPHPDDIEASLGGTIFKHKHTRFTSVVFSTGSVNDPVTNESRWEECNQYWKNVRHIKQHFMSTLLKTYSEEEWINLLEITFKISNYDAIFLPSSQDTHYEHRFVNGIGMALTRSSPISIIEYKSPSTLDSWIPNMFVEIGDYADEKIKRLERFESQKKLYFQPEYMKAFHSHPNSIKKQVLVTEPFRVITLYDQSHNF